MIADFFLEQCIETAACYNGKSSRQRECRENTRHYEPQAAGQFTSQPF